MWRYKNLNLSYLNHALTAIALALGFYLILSPFAPAIWWWASHVSRHPKPGVVQVVSGSPAPAPAPTPATIPAGYWLDIPRLELHRKILTGPSSSEVDKGPWHVWRTSTPDKDSNTVIAGHRFGFFGPYGPFYHLDQLRSNDRITVDWNGVEYTYKVLGSKVVPPTEVSINDPTPAPRLTIYTCTPLWSAKDRLIVTASLVSRRMP